LSGWGRALAASKIIGAAEVVAALGADQLAVVAGKAVTAGGANLAVVVDWFGGSVCAGGRCITM